MRSTEIINELGNRPYPYTAWTSPTGESFIAKSPDLKLQLSITVDQFSRAEISFEVNERYQITPSDKPYAILATVKEILAKELPKLIDNYKKLHNKKITTVEFEADIYEESRVKLYNRIVPVITKILGGWPAETRNSIRGVKIYTWKNPAWFGSPT